MHHERLKKGISIALLTWCVLLGGCMTQAEQAIHDESSENVVVKTIMARRSIRNYKTDPVCRQQMNTILMCGINTRSGMN